MSRANVSLGNWAEDRAAAHFARLGFTLLARNWRPHGVGVRGDLDLIVADADLVVVCEVKARRTVQDAIHATENTLDQTEIIRLLEEEMIEAAKNLEFERAAQLRDKVNELKGAPVVRAGSTYTGEPEEREGHKIWQPRTKGRPKRATK